MNVSHPLVQSRSVLIFSCNLTESPVLRMNGRIFLLSHDVDIGY